MSDLLPAAAVERGLLRTLLLAPVLAANVGCAEDTLTADQLIDNMMSAVATERSRNAIQSLTTTADCVGPDGPFETTVTSIRPDTVYFRQASARAITEIWSTAEHTWGGKAGEEYQSLGPQVREFVRGQEFHLMVVDIRSRFSEFELLGPERPGEAECLLVAMLDESGAKASICIRTDSWLPAELQLNSAAASGPVRVAFDDWRETEGLNVFHAIEVTEQPDRVFTYEYVDISVNTFAYEMRIPPPDLPRVRGGEPG